MKETSQIEIEVLDKEYGAYILVNTSECESWCGNPNAMVSICRCDEDFERLGADADEYKSLRVGECVRDAAIGGDYEGVYVMRVA